MGETETLSVTAPEAVRALRHLGGEDLLAVCVGFRPVPARQAIR